MSDAGLQDIQDLIIIKRRVSPEMEMPKGGVWKIAFADFMTAMMCFFLVMWLINAANEDTRQAVASYFNPIKLSEINPKGLRDPTVVPEGVEAPGKQGAAGRKDGSEGAKDSTGGKAGVEPKSHPAEAQTDPGQSREALFRDPYAVLAQLAGSAPVSPDSDQAVLTPNGGEGNRGGEAFRDPFDPEFRRVEAGAPQAPSTHAAETTRSAAAQAGEMSAAPKSGAPGHDASTPPQPQSQPLAAQGAVQDKTVGKELAAAVATAIGTVAGRQGAPAIDVRSSGEGTLISLTDNTDFGMFEVGSAKPRPETIRIMERIAQVLRTRPGGVVIRGHTDARPFRTAAYDNWRLSTDRAQIAHYMLVRGGLAESRIDAVEGYAARRLKNPANPEGAENRRIEILLREQPS